jgi:hypothetical protein
MSTEFSNTAQAEVQNFRYVEVAIMPWYKIAIPNDVYADLNVELLLEALEAAWLADQTLDAALYHSPSASASVFFVSPALAKRVEETLTRFHAVQCNKPTVARLSQLIPYPKDESPEGPCTR